MEAIGFVVALAILGLLAARFGRDSRQGLRSKEHELAAYGVTWADLGHGPAGTEAYPTLAFIEGALGQGTRVLTTAPDAPALEVRARALAAEYWSEAVWTTGVVPAAAFRRVLAELAPQVLAAGSEAGSRPERAAGTPEPRAAA
jgi:hypothetical protein